jgi:hypothetical protein
LARVFLSLSFCPSFCLSVYLSLSLSVCLFICLYLSLSVCLSVSISLCRSVYLSLFLSVGLFICLYFSLSASLLLSSSDHIKRYPKRDRQRWKIGSTSPTPILPEAFSIDRQMGLNPFEYHWYKKLCSPLPAPRSPLPLSYTMLHAPHSLLPTPRYPATLLPRYPANPLPFSLGKALVTMT